MVPFRDVFVDRIIGSLWPEHTPDLKRWLLFVGNCKAECL
jgi:hypothetical protein